MEFFFENFVCLSNYIFDMNKKIYVGTGVPHGKDRKYCMYA